MRRVSLITISMALTIGCGSASTTPDGSLADAGARDAALGMDGGVVTDAGRDAVSPSDDSGPRTDAGPPLDGGPDFDAGCGIREPLRHHPGSHDCDPDRPSAPVTDPPASSLCTKHEDCMDGANGRCLPSRIGYTCSYDECFDSAACTSGGPCLCREDETGGATHRCTMGGCQEDADCGPGGYCSPTFGSCGNYFGTVGFYCHTCDDECIDDSDCPGSGDPFGPYCAWNPLVGHWTCQDTHCAG